MEKAVEDLPEEIALRLENIDIVVEDSPTPRQMATARLGHDQLLLGLYEGVPLTRRSSYYGMVPPDKITIFQKAIEIKCRSEDEIATEIRKVVQHEIAHHFGISDAGLERLEKDKAKTREERHGLHQDS